MSFRIKCFVSGHFEPVIGPRYSTSLKKASFIASLIRTIISCANIIAKGFSNQLAFYNDKLGLMVLMVLVMVSDNGPLYAYVNNPLKSAVSSYNRHLQH